MNFEELKEKLLAGEITLDQYVEEYNKIIKDESSVYNGWEPHEHI